MSHDKIKAAARRRMAKTGEPYAAARRQAIAEHSGASGTSAVSAEDVPAAAAAYRERGRRLLTRRITRDVLAAGAGALIAVGAVGLHDLTSPHPGSPAGGSLVVFKPQQGAGRVWQLKLKPGSNVRRFIVVTPGSASTKR